MYRLLNFFKPFGEIVKNTRRHLWEFGSKMVQKINEIEALAYLYHEAGREAVLKNQVLKKDGNPIGKIKFIEWEELPEDAKEGRRIQARFLIKLLDIRSKSIFTTDWKINGALHVLSPHVIMKDNFP
jgi:hypothetical protein